MTQTNNSQPWALTLANVLSGPEPLDMVADAQDIPNVRLEAKRGIWYGHLGDHANQSTVTPLTMTYVSIGATIKVNGVPYSWSGAAWVAVGGGGTTLSYPGGTKTNPFASDLATANAAWLQFAQGSADFTVGAVGESTTLGIGSEPIGGAWSTPNRKSWFGYLQGLFSAAYGIDTGFGNVPTLDADAGKNTEWTLGANWQTAAFGCGQNAAITPDASTGATAASTWRSRNGEAYDTYEVGILMSPGGAGTFSIQATGGVALTGQTSLAGTRSVQLFTVSAGAPSPDNVVSITPTDTTTRVMIYSVKAYNSTRGRRVNWVNFGVGLTPTARWAAMQYTLPTVETVKANGTKLVFVMLGGNDATGGVSVATYRANLQTIVSALSPTMSVILLPPMPKVGDAPNLAIRQSYVDSLRATPITGAKFLDVWDAFKAFTSSAVVYGGSGPHWTDLGYKMAAKAIFDALNALP